MKRTNGGAKKSLPDDSPRLFDMPTCEPSEQTPPSPSTSSPGGSPARGPARPASEEASTIRKPFCGARCSEPLASFDPSTSSSRTLPPFCQSAEALDPIDAYAAGLIDGEGCISIHRQQFTVHIDIGMTEPGLDLLNEMAKRYGGNVRPFRAATDRWAAAYTWTVTGQRATMMLRAIQPALRVKYEQAGVAIQCQDLRERMPLNRFNRPGWTPELRAEAEALVARMRLLNQKGPRAEPVLPAGGKWKRPYGSLLEPSGEPFSGTWPRSGSMSSGIAYRREPSAPRTSATGSSPLLATPRSADGMQHPVRDKNNIRNGNPRGWLEDQIAMLPTPTRHMVKDTGAPSEFERKSPEITATVLQLLPTPAATEYGNNQSGCGREWTDPDCPHSVTAFRSRSA